MGLQNSVCSTVDVAAVLDSWSILCARVSMVSVGTILHLNTVLIDPQVACS